MRYVFMAFLMLLITLLPAQKQYVLEGVTRPAMLLIRQDRIYILDQASVLIFDLHDGHLIRSFGKAGEGPGEFKYSKMEGLPLSMSIHKDRLVVNSSNRISYFDLDGGYLSEKNLGLDMLLFHLRDHFVGIGSVSADTEQVPRIGFRLVKPDYSPGKILYLSDQESDNARKLVMPIVRFSYNPVYEDKVYINTSLDEFLIESFDAEGNKSASIKKEYPKIPLDEAYKKKAHDFFKTNPRFRDAYDYIKTIISFREFFPPIRDMQMAEESLHVITYKRQGENLWEMISMNLQGKELAKTFVPLAEQEPLSFYPILYAVYKGTVYSLIEDEDEDGWALHATGLHLH